jgi:Ice-binding-like
MRRFAVSFSVVGLMVLGWPATALATDPGLGVAGTFAVLASTTITNTGPSWITGQIALSPGTSVTGFPPGTSGHPDLANGAALQAMTDLTTAYINAAGATPFVALTGNLGGRTLIPGTYQYSSSAGLTGTLTLDGRGSTTAIWLFQIGSTLTTASSSRVSLINGAQPCDVFWQVGSSATIGASTTFVGNVMALNSISMLTGATLAGRALARHGAVTLDTNRIIQPSGCGYPPPAFVPPPLGNILPGTLGGGVDQTISFGPLADKILGEPPFDVAATASSGLPVAFTASGVCSVSGPTVSLSGTGICTITAAQAGNDTFNPALSVSQSFDVLSPSQFAQGVIDATSGMGLMPGTATSLTSKLEAYIASTARGDGSAACGQLGAFVNHVNAQSGHQISTAGAVLLLTDATRLAIASGC